MNKTDKTFEIDVEGIIPKKDNMLVDPIEFDGEQKSKSGIIIADNSTAATPSLAKVLKAGPEAEFKPGAIVFFRRYSLDEITVKTSSGRKRMNFIANEDIISEYKIK